MDGLNRGRAIPPAMPAARRQSHDYQAAARVCDRGAVQTNAAGLFAAASGVSPGRALPPGPFTRPGTMTSQATASAWRRLLLARPHGEAVEGLAGASAPESEAKRHVPDRVDKHKEVYEARNSPNGDRQQATRNGHLAFPLTDNLRARNSNASQKWPAVLPARYTDTGSSCGHRGHTCSRPHIYSVRTCRPFNTLVLDRRMVEVHEWQDRHVRQIQALPDSAEPC
ncbi:hypothetical protein LMG28690_05891 [Paraburkholderia caffeinilytica]|nr:hypothetical protein LMG28690_05891 [Paraburkholderia caffeinilytica]